jgi:hypothetical protein
MEQADDDGADDKPSTRKKTTAESQAEVLKLRATIRSDDFWEDSSEVLELFSLLLYYLRVVDESNRSVMGWIWPMMYSLQKKMKAKLLVGDYTGRMPLREREAAVEYIGERWAYLHVPMHSAAFCVNPRFHGIKHFEDMEVRDDFVSVVSDMLGDAHGAKVLEVITEYEAYHQKTGAWSSPLCWHDYKTVEPLTFWKRWKANSPLLAPLASRWLSAAHAAGAAERNFSLHKRHNSALRASQKPDTLARLVRLCDSQTALDKANERDDASRRERQRAEAGKPPLARKSYPLEAESDWSTVDESDGEEQEVGAVIGELCLPASPAACALKLKARCGLQRVTPPRSTPLLPRHAPSRLSSHRRERPRSARLTCACGRRRSRSTALALLLLLAVGTQPAELTRRAPAAARGSGRRPQAVAAAGAVRRRGPRTPHGHAASRAVRPESGRSHPCNGRNYAGGYRNVTPYP